MGKAHWEASLTEKGCLFWQQCLTCPLPQCRLESDTVFRRREADYIAIATASGELVEDVTERTMFRRRVRAKTAAPFAPLEAQAWREYLRRKRE